eukprot:8105214-Alexandrium_andersonii.AAC.1
MGVGSKDSGAKSLGAPPALQGEPGVPRRGAAAPQQRQRSTASRRSKGGGRSEHARPRRILNRRVARAARRR